MLGGLEVLAGGVIDVELLDGDDEGGGGTVNVVVAVGGGTVAVEVDVAVGGGAVDVAVAVGGGGGGGTVAVEVAVDGGGTVDVAVEVTVEVEVGGVPTWSVMTELTATFCPALLTVTTFPIRFALKVVTVWIV